MSKPQERPEIILEDKLIGEKTFLFWRPRNIMILYDKCQTDQWDLNQIITTEPIKYNNNWRKHQVKIRRKVELDTVNLRRNFSETVKDGIRLHCNICVDDLKYRAKHFRCYRLDIPLEETENSRFYPLQSRYSGSGERIYRLPISGHRLRTVAQRTRHTTMHYICIHYTYSSITTISHLVMISVTLYVTLKFPFTWCIVLARNCTP